MGYHLFVARCLLVLGFVASVNTTCESGTANGVFFKCFQGFTNRTVITGEQFNVEHLKTYCESKDDTEIQCGQNSIKDCRNSPSSETQKVIDEAYKVDEMIRAVRVVCKNTALLNDHKDCIEQNKGVVQNCVDEKEKSKKTEKDKLRNSKAKDVKYVRAEIFKVLCKTAEGVKECFSHLSEKCDEKVGNIFKSIKNAWIPPACSGGKAIIGIVGILTVTFLTAVGIVF